MSFYKKVPGLQRTLESELLFDKEPKAGSTNPVTSDGVNTAITDAVGGASDALQEQIDDIAEKAGSGYIPKGEADVATLNGLSGQENGDLYTMTDAGTLTDGSLAVVAGDTVAWDATNEVWYKAMDYAPRQYGANEVHNLATTITAFRTGDVIPVDGPSGTAKMSKDSLLYITAKNALDSAYNLPFTSTINNTDKFLLATSAGGKSIGNVILQKFFADGTLGDNFAPMFDITKDYKAGDVVVHYGTIYEFIVDHSAGTPDWANEAKHISAIDYFAKQKDLEDTDKIIETITNGWSEESLTLANGCIKADSTFLNVSTYNVSQAIHLTTGQKLIARVAANSTLPIAVISRRNDADTGYVRLVESDVDDVTFQYKDYEFVATYSLDVYVCGRVGTGEYTISATVYDVNDSVVFHREYYGEGKTVVVDVNGTGDYTSLTEAIFQVTLYDNYGWTVKVLPGTYDIVQEFKTKYGNSFFDNYTDATTNKGIVLKNGVRLKFARGAKVVCKYTGNNNSVMKEFSPFNSGVGGFEIDGLCLESSKVRYCVHDERYSETDVYFNRYYNCDFVSDNTSSTQTFRACIGGGLGKNGNVVVRNCRFESKGLTEARGILTWHNTGASSGKSVVEVSGCYFVGYGSFYIHYAGTSADISSAFVHDCYFEKGGVLPVAAEGASTVVNVECFEWNNVLASRDYKSLESAAVEQTVGAYDQVSVSWSDGFYYDTTSRSTNSKFQLSSPIHLYKGDSVMFVGGNIAGSSDNYVHAISVVNNLGTGVIPKVKYSNGDAIGVMKWTADGDCDVVVCSCKASFGGVILVAREAIYFNKQVTVVQKNGWYVNNAGVLVATSGSSMVSEPIYVNEGDVVEFEGKGYVGNPPNYAMICSCDSGMTYTNVEVLADSNSVKTYKWIARNSGYICVSCYYDSPYKLVVRGSQFNEIRGQIEKVAPVDYWIKNNCIPHAKVTKPFIYRLEDDSDFIVNSVAYDDGTIVAACRGGKVVKIANDGTRTELLNIAGASDWRCLWMDRNNNVYASPHASVDGSMQMSDRGLYRLSYGSNQFVKVISLYDQDSAIDTERQPNDDCIWTMCQDNGGRIYAGVYAHTVRANPAIYVSYDNGVSWAYLFNFNFNGVTSGGMHIHSVIYNEFDDTLYAIVGEINKVFYSKTYGTSWFDMKVQADSVKGTALIGTKNGLLIGSDGAYQGIFTKIDSNGHSHKCVGIFYANTIFGFRRSDLTGRIYAFAKIDSSINSDSVFPPVEALHDPDVIETWKASQSFGYNRWKQYNDAVKDYFYEDAIRPLHAAILMSCDEGETWSIVYQHAFPESNDKPCGFWTAGQFRNGECIFGLVDNVDGSAKFVNPVVVFEGNLRYDNSGAVTSELLYGRLN